MAVHRQLSIKALALGSLADIGGSLLVGGILGFSMGIYLGVQGIPQNEIPVRLEGLIILIPGLFIGFGFTLLGGYVAGRISKTHEVLHGGIVGGIGLIFGLLFWASLPLWYNIVALIGVIPFGMIGGRIATTGK